jgi:hypothetical protein
MTTVRLSVFTNPPDNSLHDHYLTGKQGYHPYRSIMSHGLAASFSVGGDETWII